MNILTLEASRCPSEGTKVAAGMTRDPWHRKCAYSNSVYLSTLVQCTGISSIFTTRVTSRQIQRPLRRSLRGRLLGNEMHLKKTKTLHIVFSVSFYFVKGLRSKHPYSETYLTATSSARSLVRIRNVASEDYKYSRLHNLQYLGLL